MESKTSLYLVPTPIGNLRDITLRALDILKTVDLILAEDTRTSGKLLSHYEIKRPLQSFHNFNEHHTLERLIQRMADGECMALISDAGTPGISDPGFLLARACIQAELKIESLPGATAFVPALVKSGLPSDRFAFEGFLPHKKGRQTIPAFLIVTIRAANCPTSTLPKSRLVGETSQFGPGAACPVPLQVTAAQALPVFTVQFLAPGLEGENLSVNVALCPAPRE
jgi:hypothetical protein